MITLSSVTKRYSDTPAVENLTLEIETGELCCLIGPSGCGKTTTLKMVNRLIEPTSGEITVEGEDIRTIDPVQLRRRIGYVMQNGGLFPHRRVAENVAVVPTLLGWEKGRVRDRVQELLDLVGLDPAKYERRYPHELSGGERQRVGVARALGGNPPVLLMDEPFGAVDPLTRRRLQEEFLSLQERLKKTVVFVTHDLEEAIRLADRIAIFRPGGALEQFDTPANVLANPATAFVEQFVGADASIRNLDLMQIEETGLSKATVLGPEIERDQAEAILAESGAKAAVVLDSDGSPLGLFVAKRGDHVTQGEQVRDATRPIVGRVDVGDSVRTALSEAFRDPDGIVAVYGKEICLGLVTLDDLHELGSAFARENTKAK